MVSLSIFSAGIANVLQKQHLKQQDTSSVSSKVVKLYCHSSQLNAFLLISRGIPSLVHAFAAATDVQTVQNPKLLPSNYRLLQQQQLLQDLAHQEQLRKPNSKPADLTGRTIAECLRNVQHACEVDAYLHGLHFESSAYTTAIQWLGHWNLVHQAFCLFQWLRSQPDKSNIFIFCSILSVMKSRNDFLHFDSVMNDLEKRIIEPNLVLYNIIIQCYEQQGRREDAMSYFLEVVKEGFVPERATFKALLWVPEKVSNVQQMLTVFLSVKDILSGSGMEAAAEELRDTISESFSRILCVGLIEGKRPDYILRLFEMAEASTLELSVSHYDDILWSCGFRTGDSAVAKYVLKKRWKMDPPLDVQLCNHVMQVMGKQKKWWAALEVFEQMNEEGPPPDARSYSIIRGHFNFLLKASKDRGTCRWNVQLLEKMEAHGIAPDQTAWDTTLVACAIKVDPELAVYVFDKMIEKGHQPNVLSYGALLSTLEKGGLYAKADEVWKHMRKMGVRPNINAYTIMISVYGNSKNYEELRLLIDQMSAAKVEPTLVTYNALITVCAKSNDGQAALEWMQSLIHSGLIPDSISYSQLIIALSRSDNVEAAKDALFEARRLGLTVSPVALDCLVNACRRSNVKQPLEEFNPEAEML